MPNLQLEEKSLHNKLFVTDAGTVTLLNGSIDKTTKVVTTTYTILDTDWMIFANSNSGAFTITLPSATGRIGREYIIVRTNAGAGEDITIQTINGGNVILDNRYDSVYVVSDGSGWYICSGYGI